MRLQLILPRVEPNVINLRSVCPYEDCQGWHFRHQQEDNKPVKDTEHDSVFAQRTCIPFGMTSMWKNLIAGTTRRRDCVGNESMVSCKYTHR